MGQFKEYVNQEDFVEFIVEDFNKKNEIDKPWSANKDQIMAMWKNLRPDMPIFLKPIKKNIIGDTKTYGEDGIRITGSWQFISSILGRLKELMLFENPKSKLRLVFRGVDSNRDGRRDADQTFVFYLNLDERSHGKVGRPKKI